jgi:probable HAF family extracellular repeat protein
MVGLGDLPGGIFSSGADGVSADGSVVVGRSRSAFGGEAFRWTSLGGMVGLGDLPGGIFSSGARGVSGNGSVVVGGSRSASGKEAFIWDAANGIRSLSTVLSTDFGLDLTGWTLSEATGISDDGRIVVGEGINPNGNPEAWRADLTPGGGPGGGEIPEPSTLIIWSLLATLGMSFGWRRRRRAK